MGFGTNAYKYSKTMSQGNHRKGYACYGWDAELEPVRGQPKTPVNCRSFVRWNRGADGKATMVDCDLLHSELCSIWQKQRPVKNGRGFNKVVRRSRLEGCEPFDYHNIGAFTHRFLLPSMGQ